MMEDLAYRHFIERLGPYGYALFFRKLGAFDPAQEALERAFADGYAEWLEARPHEPAPAAAWLADLVARSPSAPGTKPSSSEGILARSQKLQLLDQAMDVLRGLSESDQLVVILRHVEEVPAERICGWLGLAPEVLGPVEDRLKERLAAWTLPQDLREEPSAFFLRALRQHRLPSNFSDRILTGISSPPINWDRPMRFVAWAACLGSPLLLFPAFYNHSHYTEYWGYPRDGLWNDQALGLSIHFLVAISALLLHRAIARHAPAAALSSIPPLLLPLLNVAGMLGLGLVATEVLLRIHGLRQSEPDPIFLIYPAWLLGSMFLFLLTIYRVGVYYLASSASRPTQKPPGGPS